MRRPCSSGRTTRCGVQYADGPPERPYDVTGWTLPLQMGVAVETIPEPFPLPVTDDHRAGGDCRQPDLGRASSVLLRRGWPGQRRGIGRQLAAGRGHAALVDAGADRGAGLSASLREASSCGTPVPPARCSRSARELGVRAIGFKGRPPSNVTPIGGGRVALYKPWMENIDEGWTRCCSSSTGSASEPHRPGRPARRAQDLLGCPRAARCPCRPPGTGTRARHDAEPYAGGLGEEGRQRPAGVRGRGGTLVCLDSSCQRSSTALAARARRAARPAAGAVLQPGIAGAGDHQHGASADVRHASVGERDAGQRLGVRNAPGSAPDGRCPARPAGRGRPLRRGRPVAERLARRPGGNRRQARCRGAAGTAAAASC